MRRAIPFAVMACILTLSGAVHAQVNVLTEILTGGPIGLDNANPTTNLGTLQPFIIDPGRFQQEVDLEAANNTGPDTPEADRLFKHDYTFNVPNIGSVGGGATANDLPSNVLFQGNPILDIRQFTIALFTDGGPEGGGTLVNPPGAAQVLNPGSFVQIAFNDLAPGQYTLRVAGILNGFDANGDFHGEYQGSVAITPLPGALVMFLTALTGLGLVGWRRSRTAAA